MDSWLQLSDSSARVDHTVSLLFLWSLDVSTHLVVQWAVWTNDTPPTVHQNGTFLQAIFRIFNIFSFLADPQRSVLTSRNQTNKSCIFNIWDIQNKPYIWKWAMWTGWLYNKQVTVCDTISVHTDNLVSCLLWEVFLWILIRCSLTPPQWRLHRSCLPRIADSINGGSRGNHELFASYGFNVKLTRGILLRSTHFLLLKLLHAKKYFWSMGPN